MKSKTIITRRLDINNDPPKQQRAPFFDPCPRFQKKYGVKTDMDRIVAYMYLRENHPNIKQCRDFSQKKICKFDSTQIKDGPPNAKIIKIQPNHSTTVNGWANVGGDLKHQFCNGWKTNIEDICIDKHYEDQLDTHFKAKEAQLKHDYKAKIEYMNKYFKEIEEMYKVNDTKESVKKLRVLYKKSREDLKPYVKYQGQRFFEVLPMMKRRTNTVIEEFKCFKPLCNLELKEKQKYLDDLFKHLNKKTEKEKDLKTKEQDSLDQQQQNEIQIDYNDSITNAPQIKRTYSQMEDVTAEAAAFNQNHYLFEVKDVNSFGQQIRMNKMNKIMNEMFKSQRNFQQDLQNYAYKHLNTSTSSDISVANISQMQQYIQNNKQKEMKRMHKSCQYVTYRTNPKSPAMKNSAFQTTATSNHFKF
ncbi:unnamed protein product [Paramecium pentaurelia]|uniref:Uncharacterized protein n=1 Tax=Paramecium pentaurelia TaxID=43138 RepID=A0A8S1V420_9CILI|nr:unnamed protein product [Paramecium pentaurelia]